jgi:hypothetical protein
LPAVPCQWPAEGAPPCWRAAVAHLREEAGDRAGGRGRLPRAAPIAATSLLQPRAAVCHSFLGGFVAVGREAVGLVSVGWRLPVHGLLPTCEVRFERPGVVSDPLPGNRI